MKKKIKKELDDKIDELEKKLSKLTKESEPNSHPPPRPAWMKEDAHRVRFDHETEIGENKFDTIKEISSAKKQVIARAGTVKTTEDGSVLPEDKVEAVRIPSESIHDFTNLEKCECECHDRGRMDCQHCYDHKEHLDSKKRVRVEESLDGYDEKKIMELIEADRAKKEKKRWWKR